MFIINHVLKKPVVQTGFKRNFFYWVYLQFNVLDEARRKQLGPDRTCAEWILRNGGSVKWTDSTTVLADYNELPPEGTSKFLQEIDASNTSIMENGFVHFKGCTHIKKVILHNCRYLKDSALPQLIYLKDSLQYLQISSCPNISDDGLLSLKQLANLNHLLLTDLKSVKDIEKTVQALKSSLSACNVEVN